MDVNKIQEKSALARELINNKIAPDYETACQMIDQKGMVRNSVVASQGGQAMPQQNMTMTIDRDSNNRLSQLERSFSEVKDFIMRYTKNNDNNLKELDAKMTQILKNSQAPAQRVATPQRTDDIVVEENKTPESSAQRVSTPPQSRRGENSDESRNPQAKLNPKDFSVEKYFNNAHGKLKGK